MSMIIDTYLVTWTGMDGSFHEDEINLLDKAMQHAQWLEGRGAHCVTISDSDGNEYDF